MKKSLIRYKKPEIKKPLNGTYISQATWLRGLDLHQDLQIMSLTRYYSSTPRQLLMKCAHVASHQLCNLSEKP